MSHVRSLRSKHLRLHHTLCLCLVSGLAALMVSCAPAATPNVPSIVPSQNDNLVLVPSESISETEITGDSLVFAPLYKMTLNNSQDIPVSNDQLSIENGQEFGIVERSSLSQVPESALVLVDKSVLPPSAQVTGDFYPESYFSVSDGVFPIFTPEDISISAIQSGTILDFIVSPRALGVISTTEVITQSANLPKFHFQIDLGEATVSADGEDIIKECLKFPVQCFCKRTGWCSEVSPNP